VRVENIAQSGTVVEAQIVSAGKKWNVMKLESEKIEPAREALHGLGLYCKLYNHLKIGPSFKFSIRGFNSDKSEESYSCQCADNFSCHHT
jgi:hypothetical protein